VDQFADGVVNELFRVGLICLQILWGMLKWIFQGFGDDQPGRGLDPTMFMGKANERTNEPESNLITGLFTMGMDVLGEMVGRESQPKDPTINL
jgi:hypothetical protein